MFYIALPALAPICRSNSQGKRLFLFLLALIVLDYNHMEQICFFVAGILAAYVCRDPALVARLRSKAASFGVLAVLASMPLLKFIPKDPVFLRWVTVPLLGHPVVILNLILLCVVFAPIACGNSLFGLLNRSGLRLMGIVSYSVYLLHGIGLYLARFELTRGFEQREPNGTLFWMRDFVLAQVVLIAAMLTYRWVEYPFIQLDKRLRTGKKATASAVNALAETVPEVTPQETVPAPSEVK